jgi:hypothetical protein
MAKKKSLAKSPSSQEHAPQPHKRSTIRGTDHAVTIPTPQAESLHLSYWDLWFSIVAVLRHGGDLDRLSNQIREKKTLFFDNYSRERKLCHIRDLKRRLDEASVIPNDIVLGAGDLAKKERQRALDRVRKSARWDREWSEPMWNIPRQWRLSHALRGYWDKFPVSPEPYAKMIGDHLPKRLYSRDSSFRISESIDEYVQQAKKLVEAGKSAQAQALLRGLMTVVVELMAKVGDLFGCIGMSFKDGFSVYLKIPLHQTGINERVFFADLLDFLIWEDYGLTNGGIVGYFRRLDQRQANLCVQHLRHEFAALLEDYLENQSEKALTLLGQVISEQERFDEFEDLARQMGSRAWQRIIRLVDRAMKRGKKQLAIKVFEAALAKGDDREFLTKKYEKLKQGHWSQAPKK